MASKPTTRIERKFARENGVELIAGVDEAGRGPLAGPVVAAAVLFPPGARLPNGLNDSKVLTLEDRLRLYDKILKSALSYGVGIAHAQEIDDINILEASRVASKRALAQLDPAPEALVTDFLQLPGEERPLLALAKGDAKCSSIAAASIIAKVTRDRMMEDYHEEFPEYGWLTNRGYGTDEHWRGLDRHGPTTLHRLTYQGVSFFTIQPRRSPFYMQSFAAIQRLRLQSESSAAEKILHEIEGRRRFLPPPDYDELMRMLREIASV